MHNKRYFNIKMEKKSYAITTLDFKRKEGYI